MKKVTVKLPIWALKEIDKEAKRMGVTRQSIIKMWLIQKLDDIALHRTGLQNVG